MFKKISSLGSGACLDLNLSIDKKLGSGYKVSDASCFLARL